MNSKIKVIIGVFFFSKKRIKISCKIVILDIKLMCKAVYRNAKFAKGNCDKP